MFDKVYIDGDWLLYLIASICEDNYIEVKDSNNNISEYKNITTFKEFLKDKGLPFIKEDYEIESKKRLKPGDVQMKGIFSLKGKIGKIRKDSLAKDVVIALGGKSNFRDRLPLPVKYKGNRDNLQKPLMLNSLKDSLDKNYTVEYAEDQEADDIISINQYEGYTTKKTVVCTLDKDSRGISGFLHNPMTRETLDIQGFGSHSLETKGSKKQLYGVGRVWEYIQWISGDKVDNYHPQDLLSRPLIENKRSNLIISSTKMSHSKIYEETKNFTTDREWLQYSHDLFKGWYKDLEWYYTWDDILVENATYLDVFQVYVDVVHMRRWDLDRVNIKEVLKKFDII